jgi:hypothetical protein
MKTSAENLIIYCQLMTLFITLKMNLKFIVCARKKSFIEFLVELFLCFSFRSASGENATDRGEALLKTDLAFDARRECNSLSRRSSTTTKQRLSLRME